MVHCPVAFGHRIVSKAHKDEPGLDYNPSYHHNSQSYQNWLENIPTFPIEFNAMFIVAADAANFECDVYVDMDFIAQKNTNVEFTIA